MVEKFSDLEAKLLSITREFLNEINAERPPHVIALKARIDRDLGVGSLEKIELFHRIEKTFQIQFSDSIIANTNSLEELAHTITQVHTSINVSETATKEKMQPSKVDVSQARTLNEVLYLYASEDPHRPHLYLLDEQGKEKVIRYGELLEKSMQIAQGFCEHGLKPGETVAIMLPTSEEFFYVFFGTLLAGGVPVPIYPPFRPDQIGEYAKREAKILSNAGVRILVTFHQAEALSKLLKAFIPSLKIVATADTFKNSKFNIPHLAIAAEDPALIQYTSGSTSDPKGVLLSHYNLLSNLHAAGEALQITAADRVVSWLPLYHDMGLIGTWLGSLYFGIPATIMSPLFFLTRPERWLWAIHTYRGTISAAPNFAYELCVRKISDQQLQGLDLSSWRITLNGAEAISAKTLIDFQQRFAAYGLKPRTILPVYGLAESTVALAFPTINSELWIDKISREIFEKEQRAVPSTEKNALEFVACGKALAGHSIRIVDQNDQELPERHVGSLQFKGPSSMAGYYRNPDATQRIYHDGWLDSGDMAYMVNNEIFITGRKKDLIIKAGRNLYAAELEEVTNQVDNVRKGCVVAFGVHDAKIGTEKLVIVAETNEKNLDKRQQIITEITEKITVEVGIPPDHVVLVKPKTILKTSSGKLRRAACKEKYLQGKLHRNVVPTWLQLSKLFMIGAAKKIYSVFSKTWRLIYTLYVAVILSLFVIPLSLLVLILPRKPANKCCRFAARNIFRLAGCPIKIIGRDKLKKISSAVFVANHASYTDALVLLAILPHDVAFVAKQELLRVPLLKIFIKNLGTLTIDRNNFNKSITESAHIEEVLHKGRSIVIFPEGTFTYASGLRPFKLGAFKIAVETKTPICPIALSGTRNILRDENWLLKPGSIRVTINDLIMPQSDDWAEQIRLRALVRNIIANDCGEPTIDLIAAGPP